MGMTQKHADENVKNGEWLMLRSLLWQARNIQPLQQFTTFGQQEHCGRGARRSSAGE
jgi:hypothetical protein